jgi:hypothetical protein
MREGTTGGHLCIDLTNIEMLPEDQQDLLAAVQATIVEYLARRSEVAKVVTISMAPNDETRPQVESSPVASPPLLS